MTPARIITLSALLIAVLFVAFMPHCLYDNAPVIERERLLMGTIVRIKAPVGTDCNAKRVDEAIEKAFGEMIRVESVFSVYKADSEVSGINRLKIRETLKISSETFDLISKSIEYSRKTGGAFDITVKPLIDIWVKAKADGKMPAEDDIKDVMKRVGSDDILLDKADGTIAFKKSGMALDLGGVAKGYAADRAIKILMENGIRNAIVNSGGDMYCLGMRSKDEIWSVGIQHPRDKNRIFLELKLKNRAVDTSGDYEKYFILDGKRYSHIINPATGYPVGDDVVSASVIADDAATADILATALCVLGREGLEIIDPARGQDAIVVFEKDGRLNIEMTEGLRGRYSVKSKGKL